MNLGPEDAGRTVSGERLVVALPEVAGSGYVWAVEALPPDGRVVAERYEHGEGVGGPSLHVFEIDPGGGGAVRLRHWRPWEGEASVQERWEVVAT